MKKTDIERVIKQGSAKQKIKLYFTDVAYFNTVGKYTAEIKGSGDSLRLDRKHIILTDKERDLIFNSIKEPKDVKYWEELRTYNQAFLMFKPHITNFRKSISHLSSILSKYSTEWILHKNYENAINDMLGVVEEKKIRERLIKTALHSLKEFNAKQYKEENSLTYISIPYNNMEGKVLPLIEILNKSIKDAKEYIASISYFLNKMLPLQPYKKFVEDEEKKIKEDVEMNILLAESLHIDSGMPADKYIITRWEEIEVEVTDEDIEDIKRAGQ